MQISIKFKLSNYSEHEDTWCIIMNQSIDLLIQDNLFEFARYDKGDIEKYV